MFYPYNESQGIKANLCHIRKENRALVNHNYD